MERADVSTTTMPRVLIVSTIALVLLRLALLPFEMIPAKASPDPVPWIAYSDFGKAEDSTHFEEGQKSTHFDAEENSTSLDAAENSTRLDAEENSTIDSEKISTHFDREKTSTQRLVLYEFGADWCEPVKRMESNVLKNKQIAELISSRFVPVKVRDRLKEDGKNSKEVAALEKKYHVFAFPTLVVVAKDGEPIASLVGSASALSTVHFLARASKYGPNAVK